MDFRFTPEQEKRRAEYHAVCKELIKKAPSNMTGEKTIFGEKEGWEYFKYWAKEAGSPYHGRKNTGAQATALTRSCWQKPWDITGALASILLG